MKRSRPNIAGLMALILSLALAFAALRGSSALWASITFTAVVAILCLALLGALYCQRPARIAWTGFAAFGWAYLAMTFGPWPNGNGVTAPPFPTMLAYESLQRSRAPSRVSINGTIYPGIEAFESGPPAESLTDIHEGIIYHVPADQLPKGWTLVASDVRKPDAEVIALPTNAPGFSIPIAPSQPPPAGAGRGPASRGGLPATAPNPACDRGDRVRRDRCGRRADLRRLHRARAPGGPAPDSAPA